MNILIIGYGSIAKKHIAALELMDLDFHFWALRSIGSNPMNGVKNIYDYNEIPKNIDFVIISNPTNKHIDTIKKLVPLRLPLFIEKPIAHTLDNLNETISAIKNYNLITYVACVLRFHPCLLYVKKYLEEGVQRINEVNIYCGSYLPDWRLNEDYKNIYSAQAANGGGVHLDLFHEIDYTVWLFGDPWKSSGILESKSSLDIDAFDYANYTFRYDSFNVNMVLNYYRKFPKRKMEIVFSDKIWEIDLISGVIIENDEYEIFKTHTSIADLYKEQLNYFINSIKRQQDTENNFESSAKILQYCLNYE